MTPCTYTKRELWREAGHLEAALRRAIQDSTYERGHAEDIIRFARLLRLAERRYVRRWKTYFNSTKSI